MVEIKISVNTENVVQLLLKPVLEKGTKTLTSVDAQLQVLPLLHHA